MVATARLTRKSTPDGLGERAIGGAKVVAGLHSVTVKLLLVAVVVLASCGGAALPDPCPGVSSCEPVEPPAREMPGG